jgi:hypothetical protein
VRVTEPAILEQVASSYRGIGWPAEAAGDSFHRALQRLSAGPPPWLRYLFTFHTVIGLSTTEPNGATRWRFSRRRHLRPLRPGQAAVMGRHSSASGRAIDLNPGCQGDLARQPIGSHRDLPLPFHADAPHRRVPAREGQRDPDRALPPGPSRSTRPPFPVAGRGDPALSADAAAGVCRLGTILPQGLAGGRQRSPRAFAPGVAGNTAPSLRPLLALLSLAPALDSADAIAGLPRRPAGS